MKKLSIFFFVLAFVFGNFCLKLFGSGMAMEPAMASAYGMMGELAAQSQQLGCCGSAHQETQKIVANLAPALEKIQAKIFVPAIWLVLIIAFSFQIMTNAFALRQSRRVFISAGPPSLTGSIVKRE